MYLLMGVYEGQEREIYSEIVAKSQCLDTIKRYVEENRLKNEINIFRKRSLLCAAIDYEIVDVSNITEI